MTFGPASHSLCNIEPCPGSNVYGVLLWVDNKTLEQLDGFCGFPHYYDRWTVDVEAEGRTERAHVYGSSQVNRELTPTHQYLTTILSGLRSCAQAPESYLQSIAAMGATQS